MTRTAEERALALAGRVVLVEYDPAWPAAFEHARTVMLRACSDVVLRIEHIGSTAVPGLLAKPTLDIMPVLRKHEDGELLARRLALLGYLYKGEHGIAGRHYLSRWEREDPHILKHNVHAYAETHPEALRHLAFRDALRGDAVLRERYAALKQLLAAAHQNDIEAYASAKSEFVDAVVAAAGGPPRAAAT